MSAPTLMLAAWAIEAAFGWPDWLFRWIRHPVVWIGALIGKLEQALNRKSWPHGVRYVAGLVTSLTVIALVSMVASLVALALPNTWGGFLIEATIASSLLASRSLYSHVANVARPLAAGELEHARHAVSLIVGRDPRELDEPAIARASIESLAENASDGVIAPLFWGALFGLPGVAAYKAINTLDSVIGHRSDRYTAFGGFAARLDDVVNLIPARLTGLLIAMASARPSALKVMLRDARRHRSPNAGWPEAAMAGALAVRLSGPRFYGDRRSDEPWHNSEAPDPAPQNIHRALSLYLKAMGLGATFLIALGLTQELL